MPGTTLAGAAVLVLLVPGVSLAKPVSFKFTGSKAVAPGVTYKTFKMKVKRGKVRGHVLDVDLSNPQASLGLLHPPAVAQRMRVTAMANAQGAVAGVNGDFFNIKDSQKRRVPPTGSADGPEIADGRDRKAAVPIGQRFGPRLPPGSSGEDVFGVGMDGIARVGALRLEGTVREGAPLRGLNQFALPVHGIGAYTGDWGAMPRIRATCGTDTVRSAPCASDVAEATVTDGIVTTVSEHIGAGLIPPGTTVLVGREQGAATLRALLPGQPLPLDYRLVSNEPFKFAVGGYTILRDGRPLTGLSPTSPMPSTATGVSRDGRRVYLTVVDGRSKRSRGLTAKQLASLLVRLGAKDGLYLDGGGSSTMATRKPGEPTVKVRNRPSDGSERAVANGIGVFTH